MKLLGSLLILISSLFAAEAFVTKNSVVAGEQVVLVLSASGKSVKFPEITSVGGFEVISTGIQQNIEIVNGRTTKRFEKHYAFLPFKSIDIAPFEIEVDGKIELTKPLRVEVKKADMSNSPFTLEMRVKDTNVMQFEAVAVEFIFKREENFDVRELRFTPPKFDGFWVKEGIKSKPELQNGFVIQKVNFFIFPQKSGSFEINPARVDIGVINQSRDIFSRLTNQLTWKTVFSNSLNLQVKKLEGASLYGNFDISIEVDKKEIEQNEAVNVVLKIVGNGNFDDIEPFVPEIKNANIFSDKPTVKSIATHDVMKGEFVQKFSISSLEDFTIPPFLITYYDSETKTITTKSTEAIDIYVNKTAEEESVQLTSSKTEIGLEPKNNYLSLVIAFVCGVMVTVFVIFVIRRKKYVLPKFKNNKERLKSLLKRRGESEETDRQIRELEAKIYKKRVD